jgi:hypothetical protein
MSAARRLATWLLRAVSRWASHDDERWAQAMLRELEVIDSDRDAVSWALGSTTALLRQLLGQTVALKNIRRIGRTTGSILAGIGLGASFFMFSAAGLLRLAFHMFPGWQAEHARLAEWFTAIVLPEIAFVATGVWVWRTTRFRFVGTGIVLAAIILMLHFVVHVAT